MEYEIYRFVAGRSLVEPAQTGQDSSDPNKCLEIIQMADIPSAGSSKRNPAKGKGKKEAAKPKEKEKVVAPKTTERATRSNQAAPAAPAAAPVDDAREYYSAKRRRQPKQAEPVLVKNSGNSLSALAQMATAHADSSEERSPAHWSDVDDSDSDLEENKVGRKRAAVRATEKKPRRSEKRHGGDSSRLVWTEDMDALLKEGVALYKAQGWQKVSEHVGEDITVAQCANRWHNYLSKIQHEGSQRRAWTAEEDALLIEGVAKFKAQGWVKVAEHVGHGVSIPQCANRWHGYLGKVNQEGTKVGSFSRDEIYKLKELVPQCVVKARWSEEHEGMIQERTDWEAVATEMGRIAHDCWCQWRLMQKKTTTDE